MKKILVLGISGAGKTTFSTQLSQKLNLPLVHLDQHYWNPNWVDTPRDLWREKVAHLVDQDEWVMDGNFAGSLDIRVPQADTIFILEYNRYLAIYRALKRSLLSYGKTRFDMGKECPERIDFDFLRYIWSFNKTHRPKVNEAIQLYGEGKTIFRFKSPRKLKRFLGSL